MEEDQPEEQQQENTTIIIDTTLAIHNRFPPYIYSMPHLENNCIVDNAFNSNRTYYSTQTADVYFRFNTAEGIKHIAAHKCILASDSEIFLQMFSPQNLQRNVIDIKEPMNIFNTFLQTFYNESVGIKFDEVVKLAQIAHHYKAEKCKQVCIDFLTKAAIFESPFILKTLSIAIQFRNARLRKLCVKQIKRFGSLLIETIEFFQSSRNCVKCLVQIQFDGRDELKLLHMCDLWWKNYCHRSQLDPESTENVRANFKSILKHIDFSGFTATQLGRTHVHYMYYFDHLDLQDHLHQINIKRNSNEPYVRPEFSDAKLYYSVIKINNSTQSIQKMFNNRFTSDFLITFIQDNVTVHLHKCVLFSRIRDYSGIVNNKNSITLTSSSNVAQFCRVLYGKPVEVNVDNIIGAGHFGQLFGVDAFNLDYLLPVMVNLLTNEHLFDAINLADRIDWTSERFVDESLDFLTSDEFDFLEATRSHAFLHCLRDSLQFILENAYRNVSELFFFDQLIRWAIEQCNQSPDDIDPTVPENVRGMIGNLMSGIRFARMSALELTNCLQIPRYRNLLNADDLRFIQECIDGISK